MPPKKNKLVAKTSEVTTRNRLISKKVIHLTKSNNGVVSLDEIKKVYNHLIEKKKIREEDIFIQVMSHRELTLKPLGTTDFKDWTNEEYFSNRATWWQGDTVDFEYARICVVSSGVNLMKENE